MSGLPVAPLIAPLGRVQASVRRGDTVRVEVVVRTRKVGHFFPGGTVDAFDCWVELEARDNHGHTIFWSGEAADNGHGPVDPGAHFYRSLQLDAHGNPINKRNAWSTRATMYAHLIPPGAADTVHYRLKIPEDCGDSITLTAKLNYRKFSWWNTQWAFAGVRDPADPHPDVAKDHDDGRWVFQGSLADVSANPKQIPDVPTVVMSQNTVTIPVVAKTAPPFAEKLAFNPQGPRALERLWHRPAVAGGFEGRGAGFRVCYEARTSVCRRMGEHCARAHSGRQHRRRETGPGKSPRRESPAGKRPLFSRARLQGGRAISGGI